MASHLGSTMKLTGSKGEITASFTYGTYGDLLSGDNRLTKFLYNGRCGVTTDDNGLYYMRQRYYNPETRRFINRDVISGNIRNSQSMNRYSYVQGNPVSYTDPFGLSPLSSLFTGTGFAHVVLGLIGCVPGPVGIAANLIDAGIYAFIDHDPGMALLSLMGAASMGLGSVAKLAAGGGKLAKTARYMRTVCDLVSNTICFAKNASDFMATGYGMYEKYCIQGKEFNLREGSRELLLLGMSAAGCMISGNGIGRETRELAGMLRNDNVAGKIKAAMTAFSKDNRGGVDLDAFGRRKGGSGSRIVNQPKNVERQAKKLSPEARAGYERAIEALESGDTRGLNDHPLSANRSGQRAIDIRGTGRGRGAGRIIYEFGENDIINIIEIITDHKY